jgi:DNA invertase Pin-like site-specific DNA recombinase
MTKFIAYTRVSTQDQGKSGLGLAAQAEAITRFIAFDDFNLIETYTDIASGKDNNRPQLLAAIARCKKEKATLIVAKLDRLTRNAAFALGLVDQGLPVTICDCPTAGSLEYGFRALIAEEEGRKISERTKAALQAAKARGQVLGNPNVTEVGALGVQANQEKAQTHAEQIFPIIEKIRKMGVSSLRGIAGELEFRKDAVTSRGGVWSAQQVSNVLARCEA